MLGLRPAVAADQDFCFRLHRAALGEYVEAVWGWDDEDQRRRHRASFTPGRWQIVTVDGLDVGVLVVEHRPAEIWLGLIEIGPRHQNRGIGGQLLRLLAGHRQRIVLEVLAVNTRAYAFYRRHGFGETGRRDGKILLAREPGQED